jgi:subtilisin family serine protease
MGPIVPVIGTGVAIGTVGPAVGRASLPAAGGSSGGPPGTRAAVHVPPPNEQRYVKDEVVLEFRGDVTPQQTAPILARYRLAPLDRAYFPLTNTTVLRGKITDRRSVRTVLNQLRSETAFIDAQANFIYKASEQQRATFAVPQPETPPATPVAATSGARPAAGDPAQYALAKLRLTEAHSLATGNRVLVAVIDSGIDLRHPELQGAVTGSFDALNKLEKPHAHGTAIAGAIAAHARLLGVAPSARILAIRAFGAAGVSAEATTFAIIKGVQHATAQGARIINMSFAGPEDPGLARHLALAKASGVVLVAASGNLGPKSPPQYPAANPNVIAVSATDAGDRIFRSANIGPHVAVTAPGVDILLPAPNSDYQLTSGTSFAAAHVSGIVALILERKPDLTPDAVRAILMASARDLGPHGRDNEFGAGLVDAYQAILSVEPGTTGGPPPADAPAVAAQ